jgi:hypothetical protein
MTRCYAHRQSCSLGPLPPRTPARPDPQVPREANLGPARWGKIGAFYFYVQGSKDDPAFGLFDIEVSLQRLSGGKARLDIYAIADGYQQGGASGSQHPVTISLTQGDSMVSRFDWAFPEILDGHADPLTHSRDFDLGAAEWERVDRIEFDLANG